MWLPVIHSGCRYAYTSYVAVRLENHHWTDSSVANYRLTHGTSRRWFEALTGFLLASGPWIVYENLVIALDCLRGPGLARPLLARWRNPRPPPCLIGSSLDFNLLRSPSFGCLVIGGSTWSSSCDGCLHELGILRGCLCVRPVQVVLLKQRSSFRASSIA